MSKRQTPTESPLTNAAPPSSGSTGSSGQNDEARPYVFVDACLSKTIPSLLCSRLVDHPDCPDACHLFDLADQFKPDEDDDVWAAHCKAHNWLVLTKDSSRSNVGPKLRIVCRTLGLTHFSVSPNVAARGTSTVVDAVVALWPQIARAWRTPKSTRYRVRFADDGSFQLDRMEP